MDTAKKLIFLKGQDMTNSISSIEFRNNKYEVVFNNSSGPYYYDSYNVKIFESIDPNTVVFRHKGKIITNIDEIYDLGENYKVVFAKNKKDKTYKRNDVQISKNYLAEDQIKKVFQYFKDIATAIHIKPKNDTNDDSKVKINLRPKYDKITAIEDSEVLKVFSVFDLLDKGHAEKRKIFLKNHKRISKHLSENLAYAEIEEVLKLPEFSALGCAVHYQNRRKTPDFRHGDIRRRSFLNF